MVDDDDYLFTIIEVIGLTLIMFIVVNGKVNVKVKFPMSFS
jgi:hypothetical protein